MVETRNATGLPAHLAEGYLAFIDRRLPEEQARWNQLAEVGQSPTTMVVGCCDSRVSPDVIFNARPGELFVLRNIANLVPPYGPDAAMSEAAAALEYAVQALRVRHIVVLGHARCGGVNAFADRQRKPLSPGDFVGSWMAQLETVADRATDAVRADDLGYRTWLEIASLRRSLANLRGYPCIQILEGRGQLSLHAAYFDISTGLLAEFDERTDRLQPLSDPSALTPRPRFRAVPVG